MNDKDKALCQRIAIHGSDTELALEMGLKVHGKDKLVELLTEYIYEFIMQAVRTSSFYEAKSRAHEIDRTLPSFTLFGFTFNGCVLFKNTYRSDRLGGHYEVLLPAAISLYVSFQVLHYADSSYSDLYDFDSEGRGYVNVANLKAVIKSHSIICLRYIEHAKRKK